MTERSGACTRLMIAWTYIVRSAEVGWGILAGDSGPLR